MSRMKMRTLGGAALLATCIPTLTLAASADGKFKKIDDIIKGLESSTQKETVLVTEPKKPVSPLQQAKQEVSTSKVWTAQQGKESVRPSVKKHVTTPTVTPTPANEKHREYSRVVKEPVQPSSTVEATKKNDTRLSELPPYSRFHFEKNLFIPAHKQGVLFVNGENAYTIEANTDHLDILAKRSAGDNACAFTSSKSYMMMRGGSSFLEADSVEFLETSNAGETILFAQVAFAPKPVKNIEGADVNVKLTCRIPSHLYNDLKKYTLGELNKGVGDIFTFELPQFIEI